MIATGLRAGFVFALILVGCSSGGSAHDPCSSGELLFESTRWESRVGVSSVAFGEAHAAYVSIGVESELFVAPLLGGSQFDESAAKRADLPEFVSGHALWEPVKSVFVVAISFGGSAASVLYEVDPDTLEVTQLTRLPGQITGPATLGPESETIVASMSGLSEFDDPAELVRIDLQTLEVGRIDAASQERDADQSDRDPEFLSDGSLVFRRGRLLSSEQPVPSIDLLTLPAEATSPVSVELPDVIPFHLRVLRSDVLVVAGPSRDRSSFGVWAASVGPGGVASLSEQAWRLVSRDPISILAAAPDGLFAASRPAPGAGTEVVVYSVCSNS